MEKLVKQYVGIILFLLIGFSLKGSGDLAWDNVLSYGGSGQQSLNDMVGDSLGNLYITGVFYESATLDNIPLQTDTANLSGGFVAKLDSSGKVIWAERISFNNNSYVSKNSICIDKTLNVYVLGYNSEKFTFLKKYSNNGIEKWTRTWNDIHGDYHYNKSVAIIDSLICALGENWTYLYDTAGNHINHIYKGFDCISVDENKNFIVAKNNVIYSCDTLLNLTDTITMYDFSLHIGGINVKDSSIYITGGTDPNGNGRFKMYTAKLDFEGNELWSHVSVGGEFSEAPGNTIIFDEQNKVIVTGSFRQEVTFDSITIGAPGRYGVYVSKYDIETGKFESFIHAESANGLYSRGLYLRSNNDLVVAGTLEYPLGISISFGDIMVPCEGNSDFFVATIKEAELVAELSGKVTLNDEPERTYVEISKKKDDNTYELVYRGLTDISGKYKFTTYSSGAYLIKSDNFQNVNTYYQNSYLWNLGEQITIETDSVINDIDIDILQCEPMMGEDNITGTIYSADGSVKRFVDIILVSSEDQLMAYTRSDTMGYYCFTNVPKGQFKILVDNEGTYMDSYYEINNSEKSAKITSTNSIDYNNCDYIFKSDNKIHKLNSITANHIKTSNSPILIYPNPARSFIFVNVASFTDSDSVVRIFTLMGDCVYESKFNSSAIDISFLKDGMYYVKINNQIARFIKQN